MMYNEQYYKSLNYSNYLDRSIRYEKLCEEVLWLLKSVNLLREPIIDYGCAVGFFVKALREKNIDAVGYDISEWAMQKCRENGIPVIERLEKTNTLFALDVFEHMHLAEISDVLEECNPNLLVCRIPVSNNGGKSFVLNVSNQDETHITCISKQEWSTFFKVCGYTILFTLNLCTIYDTEGVFCFVACKDQGGGNGI